MSRLHVAVVKYLETRRALGFKLERHGALLPHFADYLRAHRSPIITTRLAADWARQSPDGQPAWWAQRLSIVRGLAKYLQAEDPRHEVPPANLIPCRWRRAVPVLFSTSEIASLLRAARHLPSPQRAATYETLFGLLAATGMRIGEAIRLDREDVDWNLQLVVVRKSKFGKSREVVLHPSVMSALQRFARVRDTHHPRPRSSRFFLSLAGTPLIHTHVHETFRGLVRTAGVRRGRPHHLRHSFAVRTLLRWHHEGVDVDSRMPRLSTYLGHSEPASTYWYLTASPELMAIACSRLGRIGRAS